MDRATRPPDEVFCMACGPGALLQPDRRARLLRCPRCGGERRLAGHPLFVVTGASGTGKSAIVEPLRRRLSGCDVFETDVTLQSRRSAGTRGATPGCGWPTPWR